jgi:hypothetical protein
MSGRIPYCNLSDNGVLRAVFNGTRPQRPSEPLVTEAHWMFIQRCWAGTPDARPRIKEVNDYVSAFCGSCVNRDQRPPFTVTDGYETDCEAFHISGRPSTLVGWQSDGEGWTKQRKSTKKLRIPRPG